MNLLPQDEKKKITREYHARVATAMLFLIGSVVFLGIGMLVPAYASLFLKEKSIALVLGAPILDEQARAYDALSGEMEEAKQKLVILEDGTNDRRIYEEIIAPIVLLRGGVSLTGIVYEKNNNGGGIMRVEGEAENREHLRGFIKALESEPVFARVEIPVSNFVKEKDISFSLEITVNDR